MNTFLGGYLFFLVAYFVAVFYFNSAIKPRQRKMAWGIGIVLLMVPIVDLGFPAQQNAGAGENTSDLGILARLRGKYDLGEATLGQVDPSSSAMNLVLLGLRGPAASVLHLKAIEYQDRKLWAKLKATVDSIILLQPHYVQIWKFQGWNLAYNVSREWDKVDDRFYWVKEGIKFLILGTERNSTVPILFHNVGDFVSSKMGISDEKKYFRAFFKSDPDPKFEGAADGAINPGGLDSYLVAKSWFLKANDKDDNDGITNNVKGMTHVFFRQGPAKAQLSYAESRSKEGDFDSHLPAWIEGYDDWTLKYGNMIFLGLDDKKYKLECTEDELKELAEENGITVAQQRRLWSSNLDMVNYRHWKNFANIEKDPASLQAHKVFYAAKQAYIEGRGFDKVATDGTTEVSEAQTLLESAMTQWRELSTRKDFADLYSQDQYIREALLIVQYWQAVHQQNGKDVPADYTLKAEWDKHPEQHMEMERQFLTETRSRSF